MNERFKQLAEQARIKDHWSMDERRYLTNYLDEQKFAELIVRECATIILNNDIEKQEDYGVNHLFFNGWERGVIDSCQIIKQHFGVEL
jgi:hypothetical protein